MITPRFTLSQTEKTIIITIRAPYCSLSELDVSAEENNFLFVCKPYYLRLQLPGDIVDDDNSHSKFDTDSGEFSFTYDKKIAGEEFQDLDFITKFLSPKVSVTEGNRTIEILSSAENEGIVITEDADIDEKNQYGFAMRGGYKFNTVSGEFRGVFDVDPFEVQLNDRKVLRLKDEGETFSVDHYLCDLIEGDEIQEIIRLKCPWTDLQDFEKFADKELDFLKGLTNISYDLTEVQQKFCRNGLLDILFAYCYDKRTTLFDSTCESSWTVNKLSATLCYFDGFTSPTETIICAFRRSLIYPLYRHFDLSQQVLKDLLCLVKLGEGSIIKCLIDLYYMFLESDSSRYVLNNLFIKDYCTYIMKWNSQKWKETVIEIEEMKITKADLQLDLEDIEKELNCEDGIAREMNKLSIIKESQEVLDSDDDSEDINDNSEGSSDSDNEPADN